MNGTTAIFCGRIAGTGTCNFPRMAQIVAVPPGTVRRPHIGVLFERRIHVLLVRVATAVAGLFRFLSGHDYSIRVTASKMM